MDSMVFTRESKSEFVRFLIRGGVSIAYNSRYFTVGETWWIQVEGDSPLVLEYGKEYFSDGVEVGPPSTHAVAA